MQTRLAFEYILTPDGLVQDQALVVDDAGLIARIEPAMDGVREGFLAIPGMPNAHSHAFQRALSGYGETPRGEDSFWSWREAMYRLANRLTPEDMFVIAREAYWDMLRGGFTSVAEFHYLHHLPDGRPGAEMARAVIAAAEETGIRLLLLPVYYRTGGFGKQARDEQRRFIHQGVDDYFALLSELHDVPLGVAPHSLRAVPPEELAPLLAAARKFLGPDVPMHIHISEQEREVEECQATYGLTPIELLAKSVPLDRHWNLVHATHASDTEQSIMRRAGATAVICPITEAYLGDGLFPADEFVATGGRLAIGSDSNCRIDAVEELRWLEFGQRLRTKHRARLATEEGIGLPLWQRACTGGAAAFGRPLGAIAPGMPADLVVLDPHSAALRGHEVDTLLDALVIGGSRHDLAAVYVDGVRRVERGECEGGTVSASEFTRTVLKLNSL